LFLNFLIVGAVSNGKTFSFQFRDCKTLTTLDVSGWDVSLGTNFDYQFYGCDKLTDLDVKNWNVVSANNFRFFMINVKMSIANYNATLENWAVLLQKVTGSPNIHFGGSQYDAPPSDAATARAAIEALGWTITDGGGI